MVLETWWVLTFSLAIAAVWPLLGYRSFRAIEKTFSSFARRRNAVILAIFFGTIIIRVAMIPCFPVPVPFIHDEFAYLVQADMFAHGNLAYPAHPMAQYLDTFYVTYSPTYSSMYPPAQAAVLALGQLLGHPWIGVLLSCAAMCAAVLWMLQGWLPATWAFLGAILFTLRIGILSYWMNSYWGGAVAATAAALVVGALPRIKRHQRIRDALLLGMGTAILANSRPLEGLIFCIPVGVSLGVWLLRREKFQAQFPVRNILLPVASLGVLAIAFMLYYNWRVTRDPLVMPHAVYMQRYMNVMPFVWMKLLPVRNYANPQFHALFDVWVPQQFDGTWVAARRITGEKFADFSQFFLGRWLAVPLIALPWVLRDRRVRFLLAQVVFCSLGMLAVVWFLPHYAAPMIVAFLAVLIQCLRHLRQWKWGQRPVGIGFARAVVLLSLAVLGMNFAHILRHPYEHPYFDRWQPHNWERAEITKQLEKEPGQHLVLVHYPEEHDIHMEWVYNSAELDHAKIVWARQIPGMDLAPLLAYYANRRVWVVETDEKPAPLFPYTASENDRGAR